MNNLDLIEIDDVSSLINKLDVVLLSSGYFVIKEPTKAIQNQFLNDYRICVVIKGSCSVDCNGACYNMKKGDVIIIAPCKRYITETVENDTEFVCIDFTLKNEELFKNALSLNDIVYFENVLSQRHFDNLYYINKAIEAKHAGCFVLIKNTLENIFVLLFKLIKEKPHMVKLKTEKSNKEKLFLECIDYIEKNLDKQVSVADIASYLNYSENYIYKVFKDVLNISCKSFIIDYKLAKALHELKTTKKPINQIADELGFANIYYFSNAFKNKFGSSPSSIRKA